MSSMPFYNPELSRADFAPTNGSVSDVVELLASQDVLKQIDQGNMTLAMIRPQVGPDANLEQLPDTEAADRIEEMIEGLGVAAKFSFYFTPETVDEFYGGGPQASMEKEAPIDASKYESRWPEFKDFMCSAPTTAILLHSPDGDAIQKWRDHLGHWNIDEVRDPATIRGAFGVNKYNNLVHGSDEPAAVRRELGILTTSILTSRS